MDYILILAMLVLGIISIVMLCGKGQFLLKSKDRYSGMYDAKKLSQVTGAGMLLVMIALSIQLFFDEYVPVTLPMVIVIVGVLGTLIGKYTLCQNKDFVPQPKKEENKKVDKFKVISSVIGGIVLAVFVVVVMFIGSINVKIEKTSVTFGATLTTSKTVKYSEIKTIELVDEIDSGSRTGGISNTKINAGNFKNEEFGKYRRYTYSDCDTYVIITKKDKSVFVVNGKTQEETKQLYEKLMTKLS